MNVARARRPGLLVPSGACILLLGSLLAGCGQTGPLYLPEEGGAVVTRPARTPSPAPAPAPAPAPEPAPQAPPPG